MTMTGINEIVTLYVAYTDGNGGKKRPVLVLQDVDERLTFYKITSKFNKKSNSIKKQYYQIIQWKESGLRKQSYIDTGQILRIEKKSIGPITEIGELTNIDIQGLADFINDKK